ncbi:MAG: SLC13 family permease [Hyphomicrobiales bacterium]|nr:MAG: SLC13 family permease [Hyphomicrobiales bacterium]
MTLDQSLLFGLFALVFVMLIWGRWRYDLIAFSALVIALLLGLVPTSEAFSGFGHPATVIIALVLVVSRGLLNSGAIQIITQRLIQDGRTVGTHIALMSGVGAILSAFMNNVAALALLMPVDLEAAKKQKRAPGKTLMPLAFATILGGMLTMIGTPPNIIIASYRETVSGSPFSMFDFSPVGLACAVIGIAFVAFGGWKLVPTGSDSKNSAEDLLDVEGYTVELFVPEKASVIEKTVGSLYEEADNFDVLILGLVRNGKRFPGFSENQTIRAADIIIVEATADNADKFRGEVNLEFFGEKAAKNEPTGGMSLLEVVVPVDSRIEGRSAIQLRLRARRGISLLGISRQGRRLTTRVRHTEIEAGDILLLIGPADILTDVANWLGCHALAKRGLQITQHRKAWLAVGIFAAAITTASLGMVYLATALAAVVVLYAVLDIVPLRTVYDNIEWPVIILLGSMLPLGKALEQSGGTALIATQIVSLTEGMHAAIVLTALMVVVMTLSDVLNNTATAVIGAPIAVDVAGKLGVSSDPFLMAVAVAASCAFLTPIGHKNNTLIMGPGGYSFGDYWRMGLPLELLVVAVAIPTILFVWPL